MVREAGSSWAGRCVVLLGTLVALLCMAAPARANHPAPFLKPLPIPQTITDPHVMLTAAEADVPIFAGTPTRMWTYNGSFPGPTIRRPTGKSTHVHFLNSLPASVGSLTLHNHGNHSSPHDDGQPMHFLVEPGGSQTYHYTGLENGRNERGAMQWYHDHRDAVTGRNVWMGLAGMYIIDDPDDPQTLPAGEFDVPLALADRSFTADNQLAYTFASAGVQGDHILVNGLPQPYHEVADRKYRLRILNASNLRSYRLELSNGQAMTQIGTESGLLPAPVSKQSIFLSPAERADIVVDFNGLVGQQIVLRNTLETGALSEVAQFRVAGNAIDTSSVPATLRPQEDLGEPVVTRTFEFDRVGNRWTINGQPFDHERIDAQPVLGTTERWILRNPRSTAHTVHIHNVDQQLITRNGQPPAPDELTKESWHLGPGEQVDVKIKFTDHTGRYVFHCHMLEHEDSGMMGQFEVVPAPPESTIRSVRPKAATPIQVPLVPAYRPCESPNLKHGPPLAFDSCGPPVPESEQLTFGTPDGETGIGSVRTSVLAGIRGSPDDEADVRFTVNMTDVRLKDTQAAYDGPLLARVLQRTTDRYNGDSHREVATVSDIPLELPVQCSGGSCAVDTTLDALLPGSVREGARTVIALGKVDVMDAGADGDVETAADNRRLATQGLAVP